MIVVVWFDIRPSRKKHEYGNNTTWSTCSSAINYCWYSILSTVKAPSFGFNTHCVKLNFKRPGRHYFSYNER